MTFTVLAPRTLVEVYSAAVLILGVETLPIVANLIAVEACPVRGLGFYS